MVDYIPKSTAPMSFNAVDALLSALHGDPVWGWLEGEAHLYPNQYIDTAAFCTAGPQDVAPLTLGDLVNLAIPGSPAWFDAQAHIRARVTAALHARLFGAMCVSAVAPVGGWCPLFHRTITGMSGGIGGEIVVPVPATATHVRISLDSRSVTGGAWGVQIYKRPAGGGSAALIQGYDLTTGVPSGQSTSAFAAGGQLECNQSGNNANESVFSFEFDGSCDDAPFVPTDQPIPDGFVPRDVPPVTAVSDLAPLLFALELKLEQLLQTSFSVATNLLPPNTATSEPIDVTDGEPISLSTAVGVIVTVTDIPDSTGIGFGTPPAYSQLGRLSLGTDAEWYPDVDITHTPLIVRPLPVGVTRLSVTMHQPATATVSLIQPAP